MSVIHTTEPAWLGRSLAQPGLSHRADIAGNHIHYLEWQGPPGAPTILLVHGFRAHARWWDFTAPLLAADFRVLALDLGGMGDSGYRTGYGHDSYAEEIAGVAAHAGQGNTIVVGHSFGGIATVGAAYRFPELFSRAILIDSKVSFADDDFRTDGPAARPHKLHAEHAAALQRFRVVPEQDGIDAAILLHIAEHSLRRSDDHWTWKFDPLCAAPDLVVARQHESDMLRQLSMPVDFIYGEHSAIISRQFAQRVGTCIRNGRAPIAIPDAGHHILLDQPLALVATLRALLAPTHND